MIKHILKLESYFYGDSKLGIKNFEIRKNDRDYQVGDILELREWVPDGDGGRYTGDVHYKLITYVLEEDDGIFLQPGYVCLGCVPIPEVLV